MNTFRLLHDEKPSRAMINLEKKISGYSSISKINKPNPNFIPPEEGGDPNPTVNPKALLLSDPKEVRAVVKIGGQPLGRRGKGRDRGPPYAQRRAHPPVHGHAAPLVARAVRARRGPAVARGGAEAGARAAASILFSACVSRSVCVSVHMQV